MSNLDQARLKSVLRYDRQTGLFRWKTTLNNRAPAGTVAGTYVRKNGICIRIDGVRYQAHRLVWLYVKGEWPKGQIDHRDGDHKNNALRNLRDVSHSTNQQNRRHPAKSNKSGFLGVSSLANGKFMASITINSKPIHLGRFDNPEIAHAAYVKAKRAIHQGNTL
jgi:hypothetical protein